MNRSSEQVFDSMCRTCMHDVVEVLSYDPNSGPQKQWCSILNTIEEYGSLRIDELLSRAVPQIEICGVDDLPKKICSKCLQQLQNVYRFQQMCVQSDQQMRKLISRTNYIIKKDLTDAEGEHKISETTIFLPEPSSVGGKEQIIEFESVNTLPEAIMTGAIDPLKGNGEVKVDIFPYSEADCESNVEYSDSETGLLTVTVKYEEEKEGQQKGCSMSTNSCKSFKNARYLEYHLQRNKQWHGAKEMTKEHYSFKCDRSFHKPEALQNHRLTNDTKADKNVRVYTCEPCNKTWRSRNSFRLHKQCLHSENSKKPLKQYPCDICGRNFKTSNALKEHLSTHTGKRPHLCPDCGKSFNRLSNLTQHRFRHSDILAFECPHCPKKFRTKNDVSKHKVIHQEIKKHVCDLCGDRFVKTHQLTVHKRRHNGVKPHKCDYCDMRFLNRNGKRTHMRTHTGEKPYKCKYCERAFSQSGDHIKHLRTHIGENVYRCELCPSAFRLASELRVHFATHKNDDEETCERNMKALKKEEAEWQIQLAQKADTGKVIVVESIQETQN